MILSESRNNFENNEFSYWDWSAPVLQTHDEIISKIRELNLNGRKIKDVHCIGMAYNWCDDSISNRVYDKLKEMTYEQRCALPNPRAFLPDGVYLSRWIEIDEPFLIEFEDGDVLAIDYSEGSSVRMELNTIPKSISFGTNRPTIHANRMFEDIIGKEISSVEVITSTEEPEFTGAYGLNLNEQDSYIVGLNIRCCGGDFNRIRNSLCFTSWFDYGIVEMRDYKDEIVEINAPDIAEVVKGFIDEDVLKSQEEFDLTDFESHINPVEKPDKMKFWFSELLKTEFIDYFKNKESVYFTVTNQSKIYHETFKKFRDVINDLFILFIANDVDDEHYNEFKKRNPELYEISHGFFKEKRNFNFSKIYKSIGKNVFDCDITSLSVDQLAAGLMFPFMSRMGGSFEDSFAESGRLREFILALYDEVYNKKELY